MKKRILSRIGAVAASAVLGVGMLAMFAGCSTNNPEVTITYSFNGKDYNVDYVLSRVDAPQTTQHFIELADAGYYDGVAIHDYTSNFLYAGGYRIIDEEGNPYVYGEDNSLKTFELEEIDYFSTVKKLEADKNITFTQSVWTAAGTASNPLKGDGLYTVYGEFSGKVDVEYSRDNRHTTGALVMYYTEKGTVREEVTVARADGGKGNGEDKNPLQYENYADNSATSLFYTYLSPNVNSDLEKKYCVFGMAKNFEKQLTEGLLKAITDYCDQHTDDENFSFTTEQADVKINTYEPFEEVRKEGRTTTYSTPLTMPIVIKTVKVTKY